jgi:acyl-CoA thioesterase I
MESGCVLALACLLCACAPDAGLGKPSTPAAPLPEAQQVVFMGDSITQFWPSLPGFNAGIAGETTAQMLARFQHDVLDRHPSVVVIQGGTNDVYRPGVASTENVVRMAEMAATAGACVILGTVPPVFVSTNLLTVAVERAWNRDIHELAAAHGYRVADYRARMEGRPELFADRIHPNLAGYEVMLSVVQPAIESCQRR